jgi:hypothetical protein
LLYEVAGVSPSLTEMLLELLQSPSSCGYGESACTREEGIVQRVEYIYYTPVAKSCPRRTDLMLTNEMCSRLTFLFNMNFFSSSTFPKAHTKRAPRRERIKRQHQFIGRAGQSPVRSDQAFSLRQLDGRGPWHGHDNIQRTPLSSCRLVT